jgi:hypothetical protein
MQRHKIIHNRHHTRPIRPLLDKLARAVLIKANLCHNSFVFNQGDMSRDSLEMSDHGPVPLIATDDFRIITCLTLILLTCMQK